MPCKAGELKRPLPSRACLWGHDAVSCPPRCGGGDVPKTFPVNAPLTLLRHFTPSCKPLGLIATVVLGEAVKAEPQRDNKASGEEISRDQTRRSSHPMLDSQRSLCSRCLLIQCCAAFKGCGRDSGARWQPCRRSPWQLGSHLHGPAIKKEV